MITFPSHLKNHPILHQDFVSKSLVVWFFQNCEKKYTVSSFGAINLKIPGLRKKLSLIFRPQKCRNVWHCHKSLVVFWKIIRGLQPAHSNAGKPSN